MSRELVEHFFRHEYGRLVATLARRVGVHNIEVVEDAVGLAMMKALDAWTASEVPESPSAWLFRVAHNAVLDELRTSAGRGRILKKNSHNEEATEELEARLAGEMQDDLLRMLFVCCDDGIPKDSQLVLALKTLCGFGTSEIAIRLFTSEANVYKRLARARQTLASRESARWASETNFASAVYRGRIGAVHRILYLLFTEGYLSSHADEAIRDELCQEALRLCGILCEHSVGRTPESFALMALMHLHHARLRGRIDGAGGLLLLEEQDRSRWDAAEIALGLTWLERSASGDSFSRYHAEAAIAAEHCIAPTFAATSWQRVSENYLLLEGYAPSPLHRLNRAIAVAQWKGPEAGLEVLAASAPPTWLEGSYLWSAVLADLHRRAGHASEASRFAEAALALAPSPSVAELLRRRLRGEKREPSEEG